MQFMALRRQQRAAIGLAVHPLDAQPTPLCLLPLCAAAAGSHRPGALGQVLKLARPLAASRHEGKAVSARHRSTGNDSLAGKSCLQPCGRDSSNAHR